MSKRRGADKPAASTREAILAAAERIVSRGGEDALSIRELCARVGVTAPAAWAAMHGVTMLAIAGFIDVDSPAARHVRDALLAKLTIPAARPRAATSGGAR